MFEINDTETLLSDYAVYLILLFIVKILFKNFKGHRWTREGIQLTFKRVSWVHLFQVIKMGEKVPKVVQIKIFKCYKLTAQLWETIRQKWKTSIRVIKPHLPHRKSHSLVLHYNNNY